MKAALYAACGAAAFLIACSPKTEAEPAAAPATAAAPVAAAKPGTEMITRLNALESIPEGADMDAYFSADMSAAMKKDMAGDELGAVSYDYRWNAQDFEVSDVSYESFGDADGRGRVVVSFKNFGETGKTTYDLCRRPDGEWRVYDVRSSEADDGSLRHHLGLKRGEVSQC